MSQVKFMQGNEAITEGAIAAGARFYAGYPITPSTEIAETSSVRLPQVGGIYVQMEDELASMAALVGASCAGKKAYTATSGPGLSLMEENLGVAIMGEIPCVLIDVQRSGPSTGLATKPAQGDVMTAKHGSHGDYSIIALTPGSVQECYDLMITAFNYAETYRTPVIFLADEVIGHLREGVVLHKPENNAVLERKTPVCAPEDYRPYDHRDGLAPLASFGSKYIFKVNGSMHDEDGYPCSKPENADRVIRHLTQKIEQHKDEIVLTKEFEMDDAEYVIIAYGGSFRSALGAMQMAREKGWKVGVLQIITIWPFADQAVQKVLDTAKGVFIPELNMGQYRHEVERLNRRNIPIIGINRVDSGVILPAEIIEKMEEVCGYGK